MYGGAILITILIPVVYFMMVSRRSRKAAHVMQESIELGLDEPPSLHPVIDPDICIGTAACVAACPEQSIIDLINNRGKLVKPSACIGHGECQAACPVDAIKLVFGTEKRGIEIPHLKGNFESNVDGIFIAGELGGMGLIRNAVSQGRQAVEYIAKGIKTNGNQDVLDLVIVGAGPAGIAASLQAQKEGLRFKVMDQEDLGGTILTYPRQKLVMTQPMDLPLYGKVKYSEIHKEKLLEIFSDVFRETGLRVNSNEKVTSIVRNNGYFSVTTSIAEYAAQRVLLAIGRRGSPRKLGVPGEKCDKVSYRLLDPEKFHGMNILVVGGGDSAVEAAMALSRQPGNCVHLSYRGGQLSRVKPKNKERFAEVVSNGTVTPLFNSTVTSIEADSISLEQDGELLTIPNDYLFIFIGGELPSEFLGKVGIKFTEKFGEQ